MTANDGNAGETRVKQEQQPQQHQQQPSRGKNGRRGNRQQQHRPAYKSKVLGLETAIFSAKGTAAGHNNNVIAIADYLVGPDTKFLYAKSGRPSARGPTKPSPSQRTQARTPGPPS